MITVNADDFGIHETTTFAIAECFRRGWLDTTTAMVNMPECAEAMQLAADQKLQDRVGLHVNLTWGTPLTDDIKRDALFCDHNGEFTGRFHQHLKTRLWLPGPSRLTVAKEIRAQFAAFEKSGFTWKHVDSHHHVHVDLSILPIVIAVAKEFGFESMRIGRNLGKGMSVSNRVYKRIANRWIRKSCLAYTDYFGSPFDAAAEVSKCRKAKKIELMVHPIFRLGEERSMEGSLRDFMRPIEDAEKAIGVIRENAGGGNPYEG